MLYELVTFRPLLDLSGFFISLGQSRSTLCPPASPSSIRPTAGIFLFLLLLNTQLGLGRVSGLGSGTYSQGYDKGLQLGCQRGRKGWKRARGREGKMEKGRDIESKRKRDGEREGEEERGRTKKGASHIHPTHIPPTSLNTFPPYLPPHILNIPSLPIHILHMRHHATHGAHGA